MGEVELGPFPGVDDGHHLLDRVEHAEPQQVHLDDAEIGAVVLVPLHHDPSGHGRRLERHDLVEAPGGEHHAARVLAEVAGEVVDAVPERGEALQARLLGIEAGGAELGHERLGVAAGEVVGEAAELAGELVDLFGGVAERLGHLAGGRAVAVGDDVGGHRRAVRAVAPVDVLDDPFALVARGQVEVDVRPLAAFLGEEALEQQVHLHRIDGGDRQRIADRAVGRRAAPLRQDAVLQAEANDVPDDQEVPGQVELLDQVELLLDLRLGLAGERPEARPRPVPGDMPQVRRRGLAGRQGIRREPVSEVRQREIQPPRQLPRGRDRLGQVGEQQPHLRRPLQVPLPVALQQPSRRVESRMAADRRQHVLQRFVPGPRIPHPIARDQGQPHPPGQVDERPVAVLLLPDPMPLQLHVQPPREDRRHPPHHLPGRLHPSHPQRPSQRPLRPPGQAMQPGRVLRDQFPRSPCLPFRPPRCRRGEQPAEVPVPHPALDQQSDSGGKVVGPGVVAEGAESAEGPR